MLKSVNFMLRPFKYGDKEALNQGTLQRYKARSSSEA
jgi:hypothetical protein